MIFLRFLLIISVSICGISCNQKEEKSVSDTLDSKKGGNIKYYKNLMTQNVNKYPGEIDFWNDAHLASRLRKLLGKEFYSMQNNFNIESPIVKTNSDYFVYACKMYNCFEYQTLIKYDAIKDNLIVEISKNKNKIIYSEKR